MFNISMIINHCLLSYIYLFLFIYYFKLILGTLFAVTVLSQRLKINDAIIGIIACIFDICAGICYVFVTDPWQLYISKYNVFFFFFRNRVLLNDENLTAANRFIILFIRNILHNAML